MSVIRNPQEKRSYRFTRESQAKSCAKNFKGEIVDLREDDNATSNFKVITTKGKVREYFKNNPDEL